MVMDFDEFFDMAKAAGQMQAIHDIYTEIQQENDPNKLGMWLATYKDDVEKYFKKLSLKFKMSKGRVNFDERPEVG